MDVDLEGRVVLTDDQAVADAVQIGPQAAQVHVGVVLADDEHSVEGEGDLLVGEDLEVRLLLDLRALLGDLRHGLAPQGGQHSLQNHQVALAAGVHHPGLLQHRVHVGGLGQHVVAHPDGLGQNEVHVVVLLSGLHRPLGGQAGDGEDGALGGLHHRAVGGGHPLLHGGGQQGGVGGLMALQRLAQPPEEEGEDHAGVAPGPPEEGAGGGGSGLAQIMGIAFAQLGGGGADGQAHVGARVAVGDGEHIQVVDLLLLQGDSGGAVEHHVFELNSVNGLDHGIIPPWNCTPQSLRTRPRS